MRALYRWSWIYAPSGPRQVAYMRTRSCGKQLVCISDNITQTHPIRAHAEAWIRLLLLIFGAHYLLEQVALIG